MIGSPGSSNNKSLSTNRECDPSGVASGGRGGDPSAGSEKVLGLRGVAPHGALVGEGVGGALGLGFGQGVEDGGGEAEVGGGGDLEVHRRALDDGAGMAQGLDELG